MHQNERKILSGFLSVLLVLGSLVFAFPSFVPEAYASHNANLIVSLEGNDGSITGGIIAGPQIVKVTVDDPGVNSDTATIQPEPDVTVNGNFLRMTQGNDGKWYGYFADIDYVQRSDQTSFTSSSGFGDDYGTFCDNNSNLILDGDLADTDGFAVPEGITGGVQGTSTIEGSTLCSVPSSVSPQTQQVIFDAPSLNSLQPLGSFGQIGISEEMWPFIQLYDLNLGGNVAINYNKAGDTQTTNLSFQEGFLIPNNVNPDFKDILISGADVFLVYVDDSDSDSIPEVIFQKSTDDGKTFGNLTILAELPDILDTITGLQIQSKDDSVYVVFSDDELSTSSGNVFLASSSDRGDIFNTVTVRNVGFAFMNDPHITIAENEFVYVGWIENDLQVKLSRSINSGSSFDINASTIGTTVGVAVDLNLDANGDNNVYMSWIEEGHPVSDRITLVVSTLQGFGFTSQPLGPGTNPRDLQMDVDDGVDPQNDNVHLVWANIASGDLLYDTSDDSASNFAGTETKCGI